MDNVGYGAYVLEKVSAIDGKGGRAGHPDHWENFEEYDPHATLEVMDGSKESFGTIDIGNWNASSAKPQDGGWGKIDPEGDDAE